MISLREAMCPVCREITIEPVTMPCHHIICLQCFELTVEKSSLSCPLCRKRLGSWIRTETNKGKTFVNVNLWECIKTSFPDLVNAKINGLDTSDSIFCSPPRKRQISSPGAIRRDFERDLEQARIQEELERKKHEEEEQISINFIRQLQETEAKNIEEQSLLASEEEKKASELLIQTIQEEEERKQTEEAEQRLADEKLAKDLQTASTEEISPKRTSLFPSARDLREAGSSSGSSRDREAGSSGGSKRKTSTGRKKGPMDQFLAANRSLSNLSDCSHDSIDLETLHFFKPLKPFPLTPPKQQPDGKIQKPCARSTPFNLTPAIEAAANPAGANTLFSSPGLSRQLALINVQRGNAALSSSHRSAFTGCRSLFQVVKPSATSTSSKSDTPPKTPAPTLQDEQLKLEQQIEQERNDFLMARRLQEEFDASERNVYQLRRPRQATLHETLGRRKRESPKKCERLQESPRKRSHPSESPEIQSSLRGTLEANVKRFKQQESPRKRSHPSDAEIQASLRSALEASVKRFKQQEEQQRWQQNIQ